MLIKNKSFSQALSRLVPNEGSHSNFSAHKGDIFIIWIRLSVKWKSQQGYGAEFGLKFVLFDNKKLSVDRKNNIPLDGLSPTKVNQQ